MQARERGNDSRHGEHNGCSLCFPYSPKANRQTPHLREGVIFAEWVHFRAD